MNNLIPAELGLEIDGTGGIIPFDIIHTEYIEDKYKSELISYSYITSNEGVREENLQESILKHMIYHLIGPNSDLLQTFR